MKAPPNRTIPRNMSLFGELFILPMIRRFPYDNALYKLSELTGMCEPLCRKITTRPNASMNQIRHLILMCEVISKSSGDFDDVIIKAIRNLEEYEKAHRRLYDKDIQRIRGRK